MSKVIVRRNFGCGTKMTAFTHRKNLTRKPPPIAPEPPHHSKPAKESAEGLAAQRERLSYLCYFLLKYNCQISDWESEFLDSMETRMEHRRVMTDKQAAVVERLITKYRQGSNPYTEFLREKAAGGPNYVSFLPEDINEQDTDLC